MWPACYVGIVEVEIIGLGEWIEVGGVKFEDVESVKWTKGCHRERCDWRYGAVGRDVTLYMEVLIVKLL